MKQRKKELEKKAKEWLQFADEDLRLADHAFALTSSVPYRLIAYHAQQCAEKSLKAYVYLQSIDSLLRHNTGKFLAWGRVAAVWPRKKKSAEDWPPFPVTPRYPAINKPVTRQAAMKAVKTAKKVRGAAIAALRKSGLDLPETTGA